MVAFGVAHLTSLLLAPPRAVPRAAAVEEVVDVVESLFGTESSRQAFARKDESLAFLASDAFPGREKELTYGEFDVRGFLVVRKVSKGDVIPTKILELL